MTNAIRAFDYWKLYWEAEESASLHDPRYVLIRGLYLFFKSGAGAELVQDVHWRSQTVVSFCYDDFLARSPFPDFSAALREEPDGVLNCMGVALCLLRDDHEPGALACRLTVRIQSVSPLTSLRDIKSSFVGKFVSVRGNIIRVSAVKPLVLRMNFLCLKCGAEVVLRFEDGKFEPPSSCSDPSCRSRNFKPDYSSAYAVDWQRVRLQELEADSADAGRVPRTLEVELCDDLVDSCVPGDVCTVGGVVKVLCVLDGLSSAHQCRWNQCVSQLQYPCAGDRSGRCVGSSRCRQQARLSHVCGGAKCHVAQGCDIWKRLEL
jgi:DNA helicase MCM8